MKKPLIIAMVVLFSAIALLSGYQLWQYSSDEQETEEKYEQLATRIEHPPQPTQEQSTHEQNGEPLPLPAEWTVNDQYGILFLQNQDMIGWIAIDGTGLDYPVMQTPDRPDYYLKRDFDKKSSNYGVPYVAKESNIDPQSDNISIYGHHMKSGKMFGVLESYKKEAFWREHPIIHFDTRVGFGTYEIIAVFKVNPADFEYHLFINAANEAEFDAYVQRCKALSFYDTGIDAHYGDKLISLSTCEYSQENNRLVVVAKKVQE